MRAMLESIYTAWYTQAIRNLRDQLDSLLYKDTDDLEEHFLKI